MLATTSMSRVQSVILVLELSVPHGSAPKSRAIGKDCKLTNTKRENGRDMGCSGCSATEGSTVLKHGMWMRIF